MSKTNDDDWRLSGQERYLLDTELVRMKYRPPSATWDHDHCEFCWAKFMAVGSPSNPSDTHKILHEGYKTVNENQWICDDCFADFQARFRWTVKP